MLMGITRKKNKNINAIKAVMTDIMAGMTKAGIWDRIAESSEHVD